MPHHSPKHPYSAAEAPLPGTCVSENAGPPRKKKPRSYPPAQDTFTRVRSYLPAQDTFTRVRSYPPAQDTFMRVPVMPSADPRTEHAGSQGGSVWAGLGRPGPRRPRLLWPGSDEGSAKERLLDTFYNDRPQTVPEAAAYPRCSRGPPRPEDTVGGGPGSSACFLGVQLAQLAGSVHS